MPRADHILIADPDASVRTRLGTYLKVNGFQASTVADSKGLLTALKHEPIDLVILDPILAQGDGRTAYWQLRTRVGIPIIVLTVPTTEPESSVVLAMGADDCLPKPVNPRELLACIEGALRRARNRNQRIQREQASWLSFAGWKLNTATPQLLSPQGAVVRLSGAEYRLLRVFLEHPYRLLTRNQILQLARRYDAEPLEPCIAVLISRLRLRLRVDSATPEIIITVGGTGYLFAADVTSG